MHISDNVIECGYIQSSTYKNNLVYCVNETSQTKWRYNDSQQWSTILYHIPAFNMQ